MRSCGGRRWVGIELLELVASCWRAIVLIQSVSKACLYVPFNYEHSPMAE
jgi:hypothetical protein